MIQFPFFTMQQLNLDWILDKLKTILKFVPTDSGNVGDVLQRNADGAAWMPLGGVTMDIDGLPYTSAPDDYDEIPIYNLAYQQNKKTTISDIVALASSAVSSVNGQTGAVVLDKNDIGLGNVDNTQQYSASNPPPYPVTSVNGQTGAVVITSTAPVTSVNGMTGDVVITPPVESVNGRTGAVNVASDVVPSPTSSISSGYSYSSTGVTDANVAINILPSEDERYIRINGVITFTTGTPGEYKYIYIYKNAEHDPIDGYIYPDQTIKRTGIAVVFDDNDKLATTREYIGLNLFVSSSGNIWFAWYQDASISSGLELKFAIPSMSICTSP